MHDLPARRVFGVASNLGLRRAACDRGAEFLVAHGLPEALRHFGDRVEIADMLRPGTAPEALDELCERLADAVTASVRENIQPWVIGGDHAIAVGTWRGVATGLGAWPEAQAALPGLLWIDAHFDAHTPDTTPSGNRHGMPLATLLGIDGSIPAIDAKRLALLGVRSWEFPERERLEALGAAIFDIDTVRRRGLAACMTDALGVVGGGPFGVSLDIDSLDPALAPGVGCPALDGLDPVELAAALHGLARDPHCRAVEIVEFDPGADIDDRTLRAALDLGAALVKPDAATLRAWEAQHGARNYEPLPIVLTRGEGVWVWDVDGRRYLDMMSAYSAVSCGHAHPKLLAALAGQAGRLAVTSRAYGNDRLPALLRRLCALTGYERALPMNSGAEAVETALKTARKWAYMVKGVAPERAEIIACAGNFHGRTIAIVGLSTEVQYRTGFGPFPPGLRTVPYGDAAALEAAITPDTAAFLVEPIQGEGGIIVPPPGYLARCAEICRRHDVLLIADEVQTGLGRTGRLLACEHEGVRPDAVILGKALGGGLLPISAFLADERVMRVFSPGDHGSTFGGNPLAASVALATLDLLVDGGLIEGAARLGEIMLAQLRAIDSPLLVEVRGRGLFAGVEIDRRWTDARRVVDALSDRGVLSKDTHGSVIRLAPPLVITENEIKLAARALSEALSDLRMSRKNAASGSTGVATRTFVD